MNEMSPEDRLAAAGARTEEFRRSRPNPEAKARAKADAHVLRDKIELTEDGVALAFTERHQHELRFCHTAQQWFIWTGTRWQREETKVAFSWARIVCRDLNLKAGDNKAVAMTRAAAAAAVERFAQADRVFAVTAAIWDQDPWLAGTPGGTLNLRTGKIQPARREEYITKLLGVAPAEQGSPHPIWTRFLDEATGGDTEFQAFLQRFVGYCLTGDVSEEVLAFFYGKAGTGKGTFLRTVVAILGEYALAVPLEVFTARSPLNLEYYRGQMAGARLVTASETEQGTAWAESQIKEMTGNETPLSGRHPYGKPFNFYPQFKIATVGNHAPKLKGRSDAMERRLRIAPFKNPPSTADAGLKEKLQAEYPAILRWTIDGCLAWQCDRLGTCKAVARETGSYFERQDGFGRWLEERCILADTLSSRPGALQSDYNTWAKSGAEEPLNNNDFAELIDRQPKLSRSRNGGVNWIKGVGLKATQATYTTDE